jgi:predicted PurR-regulated permease PerM
MTIFGIHFAASTALIAGLLSAIPVIGVVIAVIPPIFVTLIDSPDKVLLVFLVIFVAQQLIYNVFGPKLIGEAYELSPIVVMFAILIGLKVAGVTGAVFAIPVVSILLILGREFYTYYYKEKEN